MNDNDIITRGIHTDCLLNYETVKYFNGEYHEGERYRAAVAKYQALEYRVIGGLYVDVMVGPVLILPLVSLNLLNLVQNLILVRLASDSTLSRSDLTLDSRLSRRIDHRGLASNEWREHRQRLRLFRRIPRTTL